jgi:HD-like signal output (HDOD) protein
LLEDPRIELPQIPEVARRALAMLRDPNVDFKRLAEVVHEDQVLSAEALRVANSPAFRGASRIKRIDFAFARLGRRNVYDLMLKSAIKRVITLECPQYRAIAQELWRCALASGVIGRELGRLYGLPEDDVFLSGLFHDIGTVAILKILDDQYVASEKFVPRDVFDVISNEWHELIGFRLATAWDLPEPIPDIIGEHHDEPAPTDPLMLHKLLVQVSDVACSLLRFKAYVPFDFFHVRCVRTLGLEDDRATREVLASLPDQITSGRQGF